MEEAEKKKDEDENGEVILKLYTFPQEERETTLGHCLVAWKWGFGTGEFEFKFHEAQEFPKEVQFSATKQSLVVSIVAILGIGIFCNFIFWLLC